MRRRSRSGSGRRSRRARATCASRRRWRRRCEGVDVVINAVQFPGSPIENRAQGLDLRGGRPQGHAPPGRRGEGGRRAALRLRQRRRRGEGRRRSTGSATSGRPRTTCRRAASSGWSCGRRGCSGRTTSSLNRFLGLRQDAAVHPDVRRRQAGHAAGVHRRRRARGGRLRRSKPEAANQVFELGGPEVMSMNDVVKTALEVQGKKKGAAAPAGLRRQGSSARSPNPAGLAAADRRRDRLHHERGGRGQLALLERCSSRG